MNRPYRIVPIDRIYFYNYDLWSEMFITYSKNFLNGDEYINKTIENIMRNKLDDF